MRGLFVLSVTGKPEIFLSGLGCLPINSVKGEKWTHDTRIFIFGP